MIMDARVKCDYLTTSVPFIPAGAWLGNVHKYGKRPFRVNVTRSVARPPAATLRVFLPAILKS
jgi:hypothetical protein